MIFPFHDNNPTRRWPILTVLLILTNVLIYVWVYNQPEDEQIKVFAHYGFVPKRIQQLRDPNVKVEVAAEPQADVPPGAVNAPARKVISLAADQSEILLSLLTCMFLHGSWLHLIGNVWFLWVFGNNIEDRLGHIIFMLFYLMVGLLATACHWAVDQGSEIPVIGASGAIAGVLGAYAVTFPTARVKCLLFLVFFITILDLPALLVLMAWFAMQFLMAAQELGAAAGVAVWAHIGGFLAGVFIMPLLAAGAPEPGTHWEDEAEREFQRY
jgi:membrane associated rhomboid family serine protease